MHWRTLNIADVEVDDDVVVDVDVDVAGMHRPIWMGFVNTKIINKSYKKHGNDTVIIGQKYDNHLLDEFGAKIKGTESKWFNVTHTLHYTDGLIDGWIQEFANERLVAVRAKAKQIKDDSMVHARITTAPIKVCDASAPLPAAAVTPANTRTMPSFN